MGEIVGYIGETRLSASPAAIPGLDGTHTQASSSSEGREHSNRYKKSVVPFRSLRKRFCAATDHLLKPRQKRTGRL